MMENMQAVHRWELQQYGFGIEIMKQLRVCASCGEPALATDKSCPMCGAKLPAETLFQMYQRRSRSCSCCGTVVPIGAKYCPQCGTPLK